jgi:hypothetical protein
MFAAKCSLLALLFVASVRIILTGCKSISKAFIVAFTFDLSFSLFQVFAQTSVTDNGVDILISTNSTLRASPQERTFGISCVSFLHNLF